MPTGDIYSPAHDAMVKLIRERAEDERVRELVIQAARECWAMWVMWGRS